MVKHFEGLGDKWRALVADPDVTVKAKIVPTIAKDGGTREAWQSHTPEGHTVLMAYPATEPCRSALILRGDEAKKDYKPVSALPLLEGIENVVEIDETYAWANEAEGEISIQHPGGSPLWLFNPLFYRDRWSCQAGQKQIMRVAGLAYAMRRATQESIQVKGGPQFDAYAAAYKEKNPSIADADIPPLTLPLKGAHIVQPYQNACDYQIRVPVQDVKTCKYNDEEMYMIAISLGGKDGNALRCMLYASKQVLGDYVPKAGDDIEAIIWLQARFTD
ncbi:MAG: hypothetical protein R3Y11_01135 [Pseudomonadota bacterium]